MTGRVAESVLDWLDRRLRVRRVLGRLLDDPVPERFGWWYTIGAAVYVLFLLQVATGVFLLLDYEPSFAGARASVAYIQNEALLGWAVRGFHYWNMVVLVVLVGAHMVRTFVSGAYKPPRELTWGLGVLLLFLMVATAYTGIVLRWDQAAYYDCVVGLRIAEYVPFVGHWIADLWRGGPTINPLTVQRTFVFHAAVLPAAVLVLATAHVALVVLIGQYGSWANYDPAPAGEDEDEAAAASRRKLEAEVLDPESAKVNLPARTTFFWPDHVFKEAVVTFAFFAVDVLLVLLFKTPIEEAPDPSTTTYAPASIWFFLFFDQALVLFGGNWLVTAAAIVPLVVVVGLLLMPWLDASAHLHPAQRLPAVGIVFAMVVTIFTFAFLAASRVFNFQFINYR